MLGDYSKEIWEQRASLNSVRKDSNLRLWSGSRGSIKRESSNGPNLTKKSSTTDWFLWSPWI